MSRLAERLREMQTIRRNTTPLSVSIGLAQEAADELDRLHARVAELEADAERLDWLEGEYAREQVWLRGEKPVGDMPPSLFRSNTPITRAAIDTARKAMP